MQRTLRIVRRVSIFVVSSIALPLPAFGQSSISASGYLETGSATERPGLGGELSYGGSVVQLRVSGRTGLLDESDDLRFWRTDADLVLAPLNLHPSLRVLTPYGAIPYLFAGAGATVREIENSDELRFDPALSWGFGVRLPVVDNWLDLFVEGRNRDGDWGARIGARLSFPLHSRRATRLSAGGIPIPAAIPKPSGKAKPILEEAQRHLGVPYQWGGASPETGFDCSGFVQYVYAKSGIYLPRVTREQALVGSKVPLRMEAFQPGDLLFFASDRKIIDHVAIYFGDGWIIHSPNSRSSVRFDRLRGSGSTWWWDHLVEARRVF